MAHHGIQLYRTAHRSHLAERHRLELRQMRTHGRLASFARCTFMRSENPVPANRLCFSTQFSKVRVAFACSTLMVIWLNESPTRSTAFISTLPPFLSVSIPFKPFPLLNDTSSQPMWCPPSERYG